MDMPELPEVETIVKGLRGKVRGATIKDIWTDWLKYFRLSGGEKSFRKNLIGRKILDVRRRAKNVIFELSEDYVLLVHQKMTGHLMVGKWQSANGKWIATEKGPLRDDKANSYVRFIMFLKDGRMIALSDLRRFAKIICGPKNQVLHSPNLENLGPEPMESDFNYKQFRKLFENKRGLIKQVLMDQSFISGIGNIYADEILWKARIHPKMRLENLKEKQIGEIYKAMKFILKRALKLRGTSSDDYRDAEGKKGKYGDTRYVYQREGEKCYRCFAIIQRIKMGGRSAHFCPKCQILNS